MSSSSDAAARRYRGFVWISQFYLFWGWAGLVMTAFAVMGSFMYQLLRLPLELQNYLYRQTSPLEVAVNIVALSVVILLLGLLSSAFAFGIGFGVRVMLTLAGDHQAKIDLLRRIAQQQSEQESPLHLQDDMLPVFDEIVEDIPAAFQQQR